MPFKSQAQRRFFHVAEARGELPEGTAARWEEHTPKGKELPEHVRKAGHRKHAFVLGFEKRALLELAEEARQLSIDNFQDRVKGSDIPKETGQRRKGNLRTGVANEDREMNPALRHNWKNSRQP
jgi:hypothetical protein